MLRLIKRRLSDIAARFDPTEAGELVNVRNKSFLLKLLSMLQAQLGWQQGCLAAQKNNPHLVDIGTALQEINFTAPRNAPPPDKNNTVAIVAAYINSDIKLRGNINNIKKIAPYCGKIIVVDQEENLTEAVKDKLRTAHDNIHFMVRTNNDLMEFESWRVGLTDTDAQQQEHFLLLNDGFYLFRSIEPFFQMVKEDNGQHDRYGILEIYEYTPATQTNFTLLNREAKAFFAHYIEQTAPVVSRLLAPKRKAPHAYYEFYRRAIIAFVYECGTGRHIKSRTLFSFRQDKRLRGINLFYHDAALFREYMEKGFPFFHWKQLKRRAFRPLIKDYMPSEEA